MTEPNSILTYLKIVQTDFTPRNFVKPNLSTMKKLICLLVIYVLSASQILSQSQFLASNKISAIQHTEPLSAKAHFIQSQNYLSASALQVYNNTYGDSLKGFDEQKLRNELLSKGLEGWEIEGYVQFSKRDFIDKKYGFVKVATPSNFVTHSATQNFKKTSTNAIINATPCVNEDFELTPSGTYAAFNSVAGWTLESRNANGNTCANNWNLGSNSFSIVSTPLVYTNSTNNFSFVIGNSPLGGTQVARLNDNNTNDFDQTRLIQQFPVTPSNALFQFAYAGYWQDGGGGTHGQQRRTV